MSIMHATGCRGSICRPHTQEFKNFPNNEQGLIRGIWVATVTHASMRTCFDFSETSQSINPATWDVQVALGAFGKSGSEISV